MIVGRLDAVRTELAGWEKVSRSTDIDEVCASPVGASTQTGAARAPGGYWRGLLGEIARTRIDVGAVDGAGPG